MNSVVACEREYHIIRLLGHGKGGYSYLAKTDDAEQVVVKQIHHEPCDYYTFGNKIEAEKLDYERLRKAGIRIPVLIAIDEEAEIIVKEYIAGDTVFDLVRDGGSADPYLDQVREMAAQAETAGLNIDYFPTNFVIRDGLIWYVDYECNHYMDQWSFENWGIRYWSRTPEFMEYLKQHTERADGRGTEIPAENGTEDNKMADKDIFISRFAEMTKEILADRLAGIYLHGSAAMGCYQPKKSDLDFLVVVNTVLPDAEKRRYMDGLLELDDACPAKGIEMSIVTEDVCNPFVYPTPFILHYSRMHTEWYRRDPEDYIRKMNGMDKDLAAHFTVIRSRGRCLYGLPVQEVFGEVPERDYLDSIWDDVSNAVEEITGNPMYMILNLARVLAYLKEKRVMSKKEGGEWGLKYLPEQYYPLIRSALQEYESGDYVQYDPELSRTYASWMLEQIMHERNQEES